MKFTSGKGRKGLRAIDQTHPAGYPVAFPLLFFDPIVQVSSDKRKEDPIIKRGWQVTVPKPGLETAT